MALSGAPLSAIPISANEPQAATQAALSWFVPFAIPTPQAKLKLGAQYQQFLTSYIPVPAATAVSGWLPPLNIPVRTKQGLAAHQQQFNLTPIPFVPTVNVASWFNALSLPARPSNGRSPVYAQFGPPYPPSPPPPPVTQAYFLLGGGPLHDQFPATGVSLTYPDIGVGGTVSKRTN